MAPHLLYPAMLLFFPAAMALAGSMDLFTMTIPNRLTLALAVGYVVLALALHVAPMTIILNLTCGAAVLMVTFTLFSLGWIGGGDAKLAAATAMWLGWSAMLDYSLTAAIYGGVLTIALIFARRVHLPLWMMGQGWIARLHDAKAGVPYGIALAAAAVVVYPQTQLWRALSAY
jgi:prepilin peptidase CpaA